jgi:biotin synthase-like enzyme
MAMPTLEAIDTLNSYGMEVVSGIIIGLDRYTPTAIKLKKKLRIAVIYFFSSPITCFKCFKINISKFL